MRTCSKCNLIKTDSDFYESQNKGKNWCKECFRSYSLSKWKNNKEIFAIRQRNRRRKNPSCANKYRKDHPERYKAHIYLGNAVRDGRIKKLDYCEKCGRTDKKLHGHHWKGYDKEHWLDVKWLCPPCHRQSEI